MLAYFCSTSITPTEEGNVQLGQGVGTVEAHTVSYTSTIIRMEEIK